MIYSLDMFNKFSHEVLRYKDTMAVVDYNIISERMIILFFKNGMAETIRKSRFDEWVEETRDKKLNDLGI